VQGRVLLFKETGLALKGANPSLVFIDGASENPRAKCDQ
jgi:hypothetical protein